MEAVSISAENKGCRLLVRQPKELEYCLAFLWYFPANLIEDSFLKFLGVTVWRPACVTMVEGRAGSMDANASARLDRMDLIPMPACFHKYPTVPRRRGSGRHVQHGLSSLRGLSQDAGVQRLRRSWGARGRQSGSG